MRFVKTKEIKTVNTEVFGRWLSGRKTSVRKNRVRRLEVDGLGRHSVCCLALVLEVLNPRVLRTRAG